MTRSYLERNLAHFAHVLEETVFAETVANRTGWLQQMDPRVKVAGFLLLVIDSALSHSITTVAAIYFVSLILAIGSHAFSLSFVRRVWIFMPLYTGIIAIPAVFLTPGNEYLSVGPLTVTEQGLRTAAFLILRVATSVSYTFLLVLTTSWPRLLKALRVLGVPRIIIFLLSMTYRYIYVLLHTANSLFLARKSRNVGRELWRSTTDWIGSLLSSLLGKSYHLSNEVYLAMISRGYRGEPVIWNDFRMRGTDLAWLSFFLVFFAVTFYSGYWSLR